MINLMHLIKDSKPKLINNLQKKKNFDFLSEEKTEPRRNFGCVIYWIYISSIGIKCFNQSKIYLAFIS